MTAPAVLAPRHVLWKRPPGAAPPPKSAMRSRRALRFAEELGADVVRVKADDVASGLMTVAHQRNVGQIVIGYSCLGRLHELLRGSVVHRLMRLAKDVDVHVVADRQETP